MQYLSLKPLLFGLFLAVCLPLQSHADSLPLRLTPTLARSLNVQTETLAGAYPGLIVTPNSEQRISDPRYGSIYHALCGVYAPEAETTGKENVRFVRRFQIYVPDSSALPLAKRVGRFLLLLYSLNRVRLKSEHPTDQPTVQVWLTAQKGAGLSPGIGGEQFGNQIFIYDLMAERSGIEWAREVAHEYGHFALPGISGFTAPEEWANGVLGERLFLKWLREETQSGRISTETLPFLKEETLTDFVAKQVRPLVQRVVVGSVKALQLSRRDTEGMDDYTALALYLDTIYGSRALLDAMACTAPRQEGAQAQTADFLRGVMTSLNEAQTIAITPPADIVKAEGRSLTVYVPAGRFTVRPTASVQSWQILDGGASLLRNGESLTVKRAGWYTLRLLTTMGTPPYLTLQRRS